MADEVNPGGMEGVVFKETVALSPSGSSIQNFGFINGIDNVNWPPYRDFESSAWRHGTSIFHPAFASYAFGSTCVYFLANSFASLV